MAGRSEESKFPWAWVGCGCLALVAMGVIAVAIPSFLAFKTVKQMADPEAVADQAHELLGSGALPDGYAPDLALSVPLIGDVVILSGDRRDFLYIKGARLRENPERLDSGEIGLLELLRSGRVRMRGVDELASGRFELDEMKVDWIAVTGDIQFEGVVSTHDDTHGGLHDEDELASVMLLRCPGDRRQRARIALWSEEGPAPQEVGNDRVLEGTVGDGEQIRRFLGSFEICS
jgi:hypothetical protein